MSNFTILSSDRFADWLAGQVVRRQVRIIQMHHTASPDYAAAGKQSPLKWQESMRNFHVKSRGFADIAQHFSIFPGGEIVTGRSLDSNPAGIRGCNTGAICIECVGNFDNDDMTEAQAAAILTAVRALLKRFGLGYESITYHAWWTASGGHLGTYVPGRSCKTCPGLKFFGGNTREAFETEFLPRLKGVDDVTKEEVRQIVAEMQPKRYQKLDELPDWAYPTIKAMVERKELAGEETGLNLTLDMVRMLVIMDRK